ncbi:M1 family metallopeptidase [Flavilitoribacter nigricans]|uniref:Aminopeptidase n=1 Tax=Flavilitoribacter nigricans (strain ATCC 23147 / DSM 23189 / NBRC 102662 / NCIMB 1420 / SS-2) TaxID=1122177 RepID=A0A2D0MZ82_FLAN2|nr:M1 family metallopeptidase [Flavilitoribacter nigricans]PHN01438.1 aminopeptidase [Flavilitoribacter nigricans DSM 23189 = NBRC 102662]
MKPFVFSRSTYSFLLFVLAPFALIQAQQPGVHGNKFEQLGTMLPPGNTYRSQDGSPGPEYWQQRADYDIDCTLDTENLRLNGEESITYYNQSPNTLRYLWLQLDENQHSAKNNNQYFDPNSIDPVMSAADLRALESAKEVADYGIEILEVKGENDEPLRHFIDATIMRVELPEPLAPGQKFTFKVKWFYNIVDRVKLIETLKVFANYPRGGYEYFPEDGNYLFTITQWYPRMCVYSDFEGWQTNQFTGQAEFALNFGNFLVKMTLPDDYMVGATGECLNYPVVLSSTQLERWEQAQTATEPVEIVTLAEAKALEQKENSTATKTWIYRAENVRDFAWTASRKFVWDAMPHITEAGKRVMCMSYYGKEAYPIYNRYSTKAVAQTLRTYSRYSIPYPYPSAISVEAANGMEYPMICFNPGRAEKDGTYTPQAKHSAISVIIHEVGHNYFPMIINSDERQWTWMDEGLNSFVQYLTEMEFDNNYPSGFGATSTITDYMALPKEYLEPLMTNGENLIDFGSNAYTKTAAGLNILRETIMGRERFDYAYREYCRRWAFKHPTPADFFRSMEDAGGMDLDWFWRGWFYSTDATDISLDSIQWYKVDLETNPRREEHTMTQKVEEPFLDITRRRNRASDMEFTVEQDEELQDFYTNYKPWETVDSVQETTTYLYDQTFTEAEKEERYGGKNYYQLFFSNKGGLVMPVIIEWTFEDGTTEIERIPVQIWRKNEEAFSRVFVKDKVATAIRIDPFKETADIDESNNNWPVREMPSRFQVFKAHKMKEKLNPMQRAKKDGKVIKP